MAMEVEKTVTEDAPNKQQLGGIKTMPFILANEMCDKFAGVGFHANMITYLTQRLNMPLVQASNTLTNFSGTANFTPLIGAFIADSFAGQFWTITLASLFYQLGLISITVSAIVPKLQPPKCLTGVNCQEATALQLSVLYMSLLLTALGTGGIRPCVVTFAANQFDMTKAGVAARNWNYFNWYYFCMGAATLTALTVLVYIQDNVGWGWGLGIPTIAMATSVVFFVSGYRLYRNPKPAGSPLVRVVQVAVAAFKKRRLAMPRDPSLLYQNEEIDVGISTAGTLLHTPQLKCLDKAAIATEEEKKDTKPPNPWRLSTVHRVEELKSILRILPICAAGILLVTSSSHQQSFTIQQARTMDRHISSSFQIPPASLSIFTSLTVVIGLVLYERFLVPFTRKFTRNPSGITCIQRMGIGYTINIFATVVAATVEMKRKGVAGRHDLLHKPNAVIPISVFWLVPQYCIHGLAEVFMHVGLLEFLYDQAPESMRSTAAALHYLTSSLGNYLGTWVVSLVHDYSGKRQNWIPNRNLNEGRLEYYYLLVSALQVLNLLYFVVCAVLYNYKSLDESKVSSKKTEECCTDPPDQMI